MKSWLKQSKSLQKSLKKVENSLAKITAVIDIGSNSLTLVIYKKTSRLAFYQLHREKYKIKIGEGSYNHNGYLQDEPMQRAYEALRDFSYIIKAFKARKTLCVATSALRDAPNRMEFIKKVDKELGIKIKVIDGDKESFFGAVSSINLLPKFKEFTTIDIGGGSTEFAKVVNGRVEKTISLQLGHVRVNEKCNSIVEKKKFIQDELKKLDDIFKSDIVVTIGGTAREVAKFVQKKKSYPLKDLHCFEYDFDDAKSYLDMLVLMDIDKLKKSISKSRVDTIVDGALILEQSLQKLSSKSVVVNKFGVREGVYLKDLLRNLGLNFPKNFKLNQRLLLDRFAQNTKINNYYQNIAIKLYDSLYTHDKYKDTVGFCSKLLLLNDMNFYSWVEYLHFGYEHSEKVTIAYLMQSFLDDEMDEKLYKKYSELLPSFEELESLFFVLKLTSLLAKDMNIQPVKIQRKEDCLEVKIDISKLTIKQIEELKSPIMIRIIK